MNPGFEVIFSRLRQILQKQIGTLKVTADTADHYCLTLPYSPKFKKEFPVAWVKIGKGYVSYHFMPVYMFSKLKDGASKPLQARMQGKSCFNFKVVDEELFQELEQLTKDGLALCRKMGIGP